MEASERIDPGSVEFLGEDEGVILWRATAGDGRTICLVIDAAGDYATSCVEAGEFEGGVRLYAVLPADRATGEIFNAELVYTLDGELVARTERYSGYIESNDWLGQYPEHARAFAQALVDEHGFDEYSPQIVGAFEGEYVWIVNRMRTGEHCLLLAADGQPGHQSCASGPNVRGEPLTIIVPGGDARQPTFHELTVDYTGWGQPYLSVREVSGFVTHVEISDDGEIVR